MFLRNQSHYIAECIIKVVNGYIILAVSWCYWMVCSYGIQTFVLVEDRNCLISNHKDLLHLVKL